MLSKLNKQKYGIGFLVYYKLNDELEHDISSYSSTLIGEDVFLEDYGIEHMYISEVEAYSPDEALQIAINTLTSTKEFEFYNHDTGEIDWIECTLTKYVVGFTDEKLACEYEDIKQEIHAAS